ncbi:MAG: cytochrome C oxidase subunit II [Nitrospirae bacterium]|nr:cytochrome C oxidase subunit II [Nitrospirota bacterium]
MIDSIDVFSLLKVVYVIYVAIVFSLIGMFTLGLTAKKKISPGFTIPFYAWLTLLVCVGVGLHLYTYHKIPWVKWDISRNSIKVDKQFDIAMANYEYKLPEKQMVIQKGDTVRFNVESKDLTYGFGLFRDDGTMVFQMQVVPGQKNDLVWKFDKPGNFSVRSTEYSGPRGADLLAKNVVTVLPEPAVAQNNRTM